MAINLVETASHDRNTHVKKELESGMPNLPTAADMRAPFLRALKSGRQKSLDTVKKEVAADLGVGKLLQGKRGNERLQEQFDSRFLAAHVGLAEDGLVFSPKEGKAQLTEAGKESVKVILSASVKAQKPHQEVVSASPEAQKAKRASSNKNQPIPEKEKSKSSKDGNPTLPDFMKLLRKQGDNATSEIRVTSASDWIQGLDMKAKAIMAAVCLVLAFWAGSASGGAAAESKAISEAAALAEQQQIDEAAALEALALDSELSVTVHAGDSSLTKEQVTLIVTGETDSGEKVNDRLVAVPNKSIVLDYPAGEYLVKLDTNGFANNVNVYESSAMKVAFSDVKDLAIDLDLAIDTEATAVKQAAREEEERQKAEEEARKKAEAEERAKAEAEAQALAEQQEREAAEAANAAKANSAPSSRTVYITATGAKYHRDGCRYLKDSKIAISLDDAINQGYQACKVCGG